MKTTMTLTAYIFYLKDTSGNLLRDKKGEAFTFESLSEARAAQQTAQRYAGLGGVFIDEKELEASETFEEDDEEAAAYYNSLRTELNHRRMRL